MMRKTEYEGVYSLTSITKYSISELIDHFITRALELQLEDMPSLHNTTKTDSDKGTISLRKKLGGRTLCGIAYEQQNQNLHIYLVRTKRMEEHRRLMSRIQTRFNSSRY